MTQTSEDLWNELPPAYVAIQMNNEAIADPTKASYHEVEIGKLLADILGYDSHDDAMQARRLLTACRNDYGGLRRLITAMRFRGDLDWIRLKQANVYQLRACIAKAYQREQKAEEERARLETIEGRRQKYANVPGVLS